MRYKVVLFDLDGTLFRTDPGVINSFRYALSKLGIGFPEGIPPRLFIGPPLTYSFMTYFGVTAEEADAAVALYREYYPVKGILECELYPGIRELLAELNGLGVKCLVASSKPEKYVREILKGSGISGLFAFAGGASFDESRSEKPEVIRYTLASAGVSDIGSALMVGDRLFDIEGAKSFGMDSCGVVWGYGTRDELENAGADHIIESAEELVSIVKGGAE